MSGKYQTYSRLRDFASAQLSMGRAWDLQRGSFQQNDGWENRASSLIKGESLFGSRLQEEEVERRSREEQRQFEALQAKYGMSEKVRQSHPFLHSLVPSCSQAWQVNGKPACASKV